jgi:hypothetical protein
MKRLSLSELKAAQQELQKEKEIEERKSRIAKLASVLMPLAVTAMRACRELTWSNKNGPADAGKKAELTQKIAEATKAFAKAYREIVCKSPDIKNWWGAELQKEYVKGAPKALLEYYLSDEPDRTKPLAYKLEEAADEYVRGWEMLGRKNRKELHGPVEAVGNGALAVEVLIEQLNAGDKIQKIQVQILERLFKGPISALGKKSEKPVEAKNPTLGETLNEKEEGSAE